MQDICCNYVQKLMKAVHSLIFKTYYKRMSKACQLLCVERVKCKPGNISPSIWWFSQCLDLPEFQKVTSMLHRILHFLQQNIHKENKVILPFSLKYHKNIAQDSHRCQLFLPFEFWLKPQAIRSLKVMHFNCSSLKTGDYWSIIPFS